MRTSILLSIAILSLFLVSPVRALGSPTYAVWPNGHDDTTNIQAAFNACSMMIGCTVQLEKGTYYIAQITAYGFQGSFLGMGQQSTTIQALPNLPSPASKYNTNSTPWWAGLPGPTNPWPDLITFVGGSFSVSGMTLTDPYTKPVTPGWFNYESPTLYTSLYAAIEITGERQASASIDHVTVLGTSGDAAGPNTFNMWNAIDYEPFYLPRGWTNAYKDLTLLSGTLSVTNSVFNTVESGPWVAELNGATVTVCYNTITNSYGSTGFFDAYNSKLTFCGNRISNVVTFAGIIGMQSVYNSGSLPSTAVITDNQILQVGQGANGVNLADYGTVGTLNAVVSQNTIQTNTSCKCYATNSPGDYSAIIGNSSSSLTVWQNTIIGAGSAGVYIKGGPAMVGGNTITGSYDGVWVDQANDVHVTNNVIKNSAQYGTALTDESSHNIITGNLINTSGTFDLFWDQTGTGNIWQGNQYDTSSPPGLA